MPLDEEKADSLEPPKTAANGDLPPAPLVFKDNLRNRKDFDPGWSGLWHYISYILQQELNFYRCVEPVCHGRRLTAPQHTHACFYHYSYPVLHSLLSCRWPIQDLVHRLTLFLRYFDDRHRTRDSRPQHSHRIPTGAIVRPHVDGKPDHSLSSYRKGSNVRSYRSCR